MNDENNTELEALRRRAYGPDADIHLDAQALDRLNELENSSRRPLHADPRSDDGLVSSEPRRSAVVAEPPRQPDAAEEVGPSRAEWRWARELFARLSKVRRSTAVIALSAVVAVVLAATALTLVQRVQTDPLQVGAEQVARLSVDASYEMPQFFANGAKEGDMAAFQDFYGLRAVASFGAMDWFNNGGSGDCLSVFSSADMNANENSFSGLMVSGCAAGDFPAITQFAIGAESAPEELRSAFPDSAAFQFVLDAENREIVVFVTR